MFRFVERYRVAILLGCAFIFPLLVYRAHSSDLQRLTTLDRLVLVVTTPLRRLMSWAVYEVGSTVRSFTELRAAQRENSELRLRLFEAERSRHQIDALRDDNAQLRWLLNLKVQNPPASVLPANVIGAGSALTARTLDIDRGAQDGITRGMAVVAPMGLVGLVRKVSWTSAEVVVLADPLVSVHAILDRSRMRGRVQGQGFSPTYRLTLVDVRGGDRVQVGDWVSTSGLGGLFPPGLVVGVVTRRLEAEEDGLLEVYALSPSVDYARVDRVSVILRLPKESPSVVTPEALRPPSLRREAKQDKLP